MEKTTKRSLLLKYFTPERCIALQKVTMLSGYNNNEKNQLIKDLLTEWEIPFTGLGPGTNRMAVMIDGYAVKFALDKDGMIDNRREFLYTKILQPYVIKVYECMTNGLLAVCEYVEIFNLEDYTINKQKMKKILEDISGEFLIGDVGITTKNYNNWGTRLGTGEIVILDFAYIYSVKYKLFTCTCDDESIIVYDDDYVTMHCPHCGRKYTFGELRKKITKKKQEAEIGDIRRLGYTLSSCEQEFEIVPDFEPYQKKKKIKKKDPMKKILKRERKRMRKEEKLEARGRW